MYIVYTFIYTYIYIYFIIYINYISISIDQYIYIYTHTYSDHWFMKQLLPAGGFGRRPRGFGGAGGDLATETLQSRRAFFLWGGAIYGGLDEPINMDKW